jgi:hypothetical protein
MNQRLANNKAFGTARDCLRVVARCLPPEHQKDAFDEFYAIVLMAIAEFACEQDRICQRLKPTEN